MLRLSKWVWIVNCFFLLVGCATLELKENGQSVDVEPISEVENYETLYQLGRTYQEQKNYSAAITTYEKALALDPGKFETYNAMGVVYSMLGEHALAIQFINEAIQLKPMSSYLHNNLGYAYLIQGYTSEAAGAFQRALALDPENQHARNNLMKAYKKMDCVENEPCGQWQEPEQP